MPRRSRTAAFRRPSTASDRCTGQVQRPRAPRAEEQFATAVTVGREAASALVRRDSAMQRKCLREAEWSRRRWHRSPAAKRLTPNPLIQRERSRLHGTVRFRAKLLALTGWRAHNRLSIKALTPRPRDSPAHGRRAPGARRPANAFFIERKIRTCSSSRGCCKLHNKTGRHSSCFEGPQSPHAFRATRRAHRTGT